jgi:CTP:molybdopterin cytidylyltransferase MocA
VRTVQPVLEDAERELEEAAASLGASPWQTFVRVILPGIVPALLTGFALAFARATGEYGSVIFIAGNMPMVSEITPLFIITKLEQYDYAGRHRDRRGHAGRLLPAAAGDQSAAGLDPQTGGEINERRPREYQNRRRSGAQAPRKATNTLEPAGCATP